MGGRPSFPSGWPRFASARKLCTRRSHCSADAAKPCTRRSAGDVPSYAAPASHDRYRTRCWPCHRQYATSPASRASPPYGWRSPPLVAGRPASCRASERRASNSYHSDHSTTSASASALSRPHLGIGASDVASSAVAATARTSRAESAPTPRAAEKARVGASRSKRRARLPVAGRRRWPRRRGGWATGRRDRTRWRAANLGRRGHSSRTRRAPRALRCGHTVESEAGVRRRVLPSSCEEAISWSDEVGRVGGGVGDGQAVGQRLRRDGASFE